MVLVAGEFVLLFAWAAIRVSLRNSFAGVLELLLILGPVACVRTWWHANFALLLGWLPVLLVSDPATDNFAIRVLLLCGAVVP